MQTQQQQEDRERLVRVETRLVQLMKFLGANPYGANPSPSDKPPEQEKLDR